MKLFLALLFIVQSPTSKQSALPLHPGWTKTAEVASEHAHQAAAADDKLFYAVSSTKVAKYDRASGKLLKVSEGPAEHLNSAFVWEGKVYCAHSNYPKTPEVGDIRVYDPATNKLAVHHAFKDPPGSLVWCVREGDAWWCCFANYGKENAKTLLLKMDADFKELGRWTFPKKVVDDWDAMSASGGIRDGDGFLGTHHHFKVLYRLKLPKEGTELEFVEALACPFAGQGIAVDPVTKGLVGIDRGAKRIVVAERK